MSPRRNNVLTVKGWSKPKRGKLYKGIVRKAEDKTQFLHVVIENLDRTQIGRIHEMNLPLPVRPSRYHRTCSFLMACGIDTGTDATSVYLRDIAGTTIGLRFGAVAQDGSQQVDFERIEKSASTSVNPAVEESLAEALEPQPDHSEQDHETDLGTDAYDR